MPIPHLKRVDSEKPRSPDRFDRTWRDVKNQKPSNAAFRFVRLTWSVIVMVSKRGWERVRGRFQKERRKERLIRFWLPLAVIVVLFFILSTIVVFAWFSRDLPNPDRISDRNVAQSTRIYARDGSTLLYEIHGEERRTVVELNEVAPTAINATIAIEDKDFYRHKGFSLTGILRALWRDVTSGSSQGGSTITQQFVKNAILTSEKKITRKIRELVLAYQIERRFTKDQILKLYFNEIPYGSNAYGVEAAAETYFGKPAKNLSLAESAILAALPQAPTYYSPYGNNADKLLGRAHYILDLMVDQGYISKEQAEAAKTEEVLKNVKPKRETILAPHFVFYVRELLTQKYGERVVERGGLRVTTTLDIDKQLAAEQAIAEYASVNEKRWGATNAALVAIDPQTGQVVAMVGSRDYFDPAIDGNVNVALTLQQPGSSIKPIVYATAFSRGFTPETVVFDLKTRFKVAGGPDYVPQNYDGKERGPVQMRKALAGSLNIPSVKTLYLAGVDHVIDQAQKMGYTTWGDRSRLGLSLVLGGADVTLLEHTAAFGSFAADGLLYRTVPILRVEDREGKVLEEFKSQASRVLDENIARTITDILSDNEARSFIFGSRSKLVVPGFKVFAKTGTTQEFRDGWTEGGSTTLVAGVWAGENRNKPMKPGADGSVIAAPIWNSFMRKALAGTKPEPFKKPKLTEADKPILQGKLEGEAPIKVDSITGKEIPSSCVEYWPTEFVSEKTVRAVHTILFYVDPDDPTGPPPKDPSKDPQYASWEETIQRWAKKNRYVETRPALESCDLRTQKPSVTITAPPAGATIRGDSVVTTVEALSARALSSIKYYLDDQEVVSASLVETSTSINLSGATNGFHSIRVVVEDDVKNSAEARVDINVLRDLSTPSFYFTSPTAATSIDVGASLPVRAFAFDPSGIKSITFAVVSPDSSATDIATITSLDNGSASTTWDVPRVAGTYRLYFRALAERGTIHQSDYLPIIVR